MLYAQLASVNSDRHRDPVPADERFLRACGLRLPNVTDNIFLCRDHRSSYDGDFCSRG